MVLLTVVHQTLDVFGNGQSVAAVTLTGIGMDELCLADGIGELAIERVVFSQQHPRVIVAVPLLLVAQELQVGTGQHDQRIMQVFIIVVHQSVVAFLG